jgi:hypothetical protein
VLFALPCSEFRHGFGVTGRYSTDFANVSAASARPFCRKQERTAGKRASGTPAWREASAPPSLAPAQTQTFRFRVFDFWTANRSKQQSRRGDPLDGFAFVPNPCRASPPRRRLVVEPVGEAGWKYASPLHPVCGQDASPTDKHSAGLTSCARTKCRAYVGHATKNLWSTNE